MLQENSHKRPYPKHQQQVQLHHQQQAYQMRQLWTTCKFLAMKTWVLMKIALLSVHSTQRINNILLVNQSGCVFNEALLENICDWESILQINCNPGVATVIKIGEFPGYGVVWFHLEGIANILSLAWVKEKYQMTFDSLEGNQFVVHKGMVVTKSLLNPTVGSIPLIWVILVLFIWVQE